MRKISTTLSLPIPEWLYGPAKRLWKRQAQSSGTGKPNLLGDRDIEWSWVAAHIPNGPGSALDFGPGGSYLGLIAAHRGFRVQALDREILDWPYIHPNLAAVHGDILNLSLPKKRFSLVLNCSTVEHVGLAGRYGATNAQADGDLEAMAILRGTMKTSGIMILTVPVGSDGVFSPLARVYGATNAQADGDLEAMAILRGTMKTSGIMILTVPVGSDGVFSPLTRVYGPQRLPLLLKGYAVKKEEYWIKDSTNRWVKAKRAEALKQDAFAGSWDPMKNYYGIGCFILKPSATK